ncbi:hypothetical protein Tco_0708505 [Tanacetum coccineum]
MESAINMADTPNATNSRTTKPDKGYAPDTPKMHASIFKAAPVAPPRTNADRGRILTSADTITRETLIAHSSLELVQDLYHNLLADLEEFCKKHYAKLLPIMADKYEYEQRKKEKLEEVKARLDFGEGRKKITKAQESAYSESRTMSPRRHRHSHSPRQSSSVFTRLKRERSRSPRHDHKSKTRRESTVFKRLGNRGRSMSAYSDSHQESSRYTKNRSESKDSEGGH